VDTEGSPLLSLFYLQTKLLQKGSELLFHDGLKQDFALKTDKAVNTKTVWR